jgi:Fur family zinc uptake transcriptional regulator
MQEKKMQDIKSIETALREKGERMTDPRRKVLITLIKKSVPMKAYDLIAALKGMKPMSVYRALDFLSAQGLIHRIESLNAYIHCAENHCTHKDSKYMICDGCGAVDELHNHAIDDFIKKSLEKSGFKIAQATIELHGLCKKCY